MADYIDREKLIKYIHDNGRNFCITEANRCNFAEIARMVKSEDVAPVVHNDMTLNEYQDLAARTINKDMSCYEILMHALHEIASECGEIHGHFQKLYQGHKLDEDALMLEVGDLLWGIAELCTVNSWNLADVAHANIDKLKRRYPDGFSADRSVNRNG